MKRRSLQFKLMVGGIIAVLVPLVVVGAFSVYKSGNALEDAAKSQSLELAKGLAQTMEMVLQEERKIVSQIALRESVIDAAAQYARGARDGQEAERVTAELTALVQQSGNEYESLIVIGLDGKVFADGNAGKFKNIDLSERDYFQAAKAGKASIGSVVKSKATGNIILTFGAPVYSKSKEIVGVAGAIVNIGFLSNKIAALKLGQTGYGYMIDKTGLIVAHPNKDLILSMNLLEQEGMKAFITRMIAGETGTDPYIFKGVQKVAGFAPVPSTGWSVCITQDYDEFLKASNALRNIVAIVGLCFLLLTAFGIFLLARGIARPVGHVARELNEASEQVAAASSQVAASSQSLAEGASEQAAALEETSSSLEEMSSMTKQNADNANQAKALMSEARKVVERVDGQMHNMATAIHDVTTSSEETGKIIKTIDEIAFQTNLLALNAAVEAARAGEAGAGFAIVAEEVRNLAMRAAEAAKNTSGLIENTITTVKRSRELTQQTREAFKDNVEISGKIGNLIDEIAAASQEQAQGIEQISKAVSEMDRVVQQTAANAEESASASEEMSAQSEQMKMYVGELVDVIDGSGTGKENAGRHASLADGTALKKIRNVAARLPMPSKGKSETNKVKGDAKQENRAAGMKKNLHPSQVIPLEKDEEFQNF